MLRPVPPHGHVHVEARRVFAAVAVTSVAGAVELVLSFRGGSLFLEADAVHLIAHLGIFGVLLIPQRGSHASREDLVTCTVLLIVIAIAAGIATQAGGALMHPLVAPHAAVLAFSLLGLGANLITAWLLRDPAQERWSFRAALAHELSDASLTIAGLLGAGVIAVFHFTWVDPALSVAIAAWLGLWAGRLVIRRVRLGRAAWDIHDEDGH